jgi:hypothetical protein
MWNRGQIFFLTFLVVESVLFQDKELTPIFHLMPTAIIIFNLTEFQQVNPVGISNSNIFQRHSDSMENEREQSRESQIGGANRFINPERGAY